MEVRRQIDLPVSLEEAWTTLVDWERQADWMLDADRVTVVSPFREGVGVRLEVATRLFGVPAFTEPMQVTEWDPPRSLGIRHGSWVEGSGTWLLDPIEGGARFTWQERIRLRVPLIGGLAAWCYAPLMSILMRRAMRGLRRAVIARGPAPG